MGNVTIQQHPDTDRAAGRGMRSFAVPSQAQQSSSASSPAIPPQAMAFFLLIQADDKEQTVVSLPRGTNPHRQHSEGFLREGFPSSSQGAAQQQRFASPTSAPGEVPPCPCPRAVVTSLETPHSLTDRRRGAAAAPGCAPCHHLLHPCCSSSTSEGTRQGKAALDTSGFTTRDLTCVS